jgi:hypothetical protein
MLEFPYGVIPLLLDHWSNENGILHTLNLTAAPILNYRDAYGVLWMPMSRRVDRSTSSPLKALATRHRRYWTYVL